MMKTLVLLIFWFSITAVTGVVVALEMMFHTVTKVINRLAEFRNRRRQRNAERKALVDPNARCPACGHSKGKLAIEIRRRDENKDPEPFIMHTCAVCGAHWHENTVLKPSLWFRP